MCSAFLDWLTKYEAVAIWLEGIALVAIFIWDRIDASQQHKQTLAQMEIMRNQALATETAANAANKNVEMFISKECARLEIIAGNVPVALNTIIGIPCHLRNIGPTIASIEEGAIALVEAGREIEVDYARCTKLPFVGNVLGNSRTFGEYLITLQPETMIAEATVLAIREGKSFIHCYGYVKYRDIFERRRRVRLHLRWVMRFGGMIEGQIMEWWEHAGKPEENSDKEDTD
jgi:hypothetical protein